ncbi:MAG TPA: LLM class flavin-dependent oxidoreductase [Euzebyales bacterium]|nr:LLM class flavin-dependent oxidoreductase [Euzebyales bacterium]
MPQELRVGMCFDRTFPPAFVLEVGTRLESGGVDQLWVIEDCFYTAGISLAAAALARTERLTLGLGILPAVARNPAITAMEITTLSRLAPGRVIAGIGHGVRSWMEQIGAWTPSPVTTLHEVITAVRALLDGDTVTMDGRHVTLRDVVLDPPPDVAPPVLAGVRGPNSLAMAGRTADGLVLAEGSGPAYVRQALDQAGRPQPFRVSVFTALCVADDARDARRSMAPFVAGLCASPTPNLRAHPHFAEIRSRWRDRGVEGLVDMPAQWWRELGAIGTLDDAVAHVHALRDAGADDVSLFPDADVEVARRQIDDVIRLASAAR